ncbi:MAG: sulfite exporter TauE/SafE family protein [Chloroflexota bacterium]|nr:sulfite exporter TauE/SafE family protein [Chloroflexota bacterium]
MSNLSEYYFFIVQLLVPIRAPLSELSYDIQIPFVAAFVLGLLGALSPCQLSTNVAAFAFISRDVGEGARVARSAFAYTLGKVVVYSAVGGAAILLGLQLAQVSIPVVVFTRKALGPVLIVLGLLMLGVIRLSVPFFTRVAENLRRGLGERRDPRSSFLLGVAFSFAACPTLFVLFFGTLIPLALASFGGLAFPAIFAIGTTVPLMLFVALLAFGAQSVTPFVRKLRAADVWLSRLAAILFIIVGVNEILLYWFL